MSNVKYKSFIDDYIIDSCINIRSEFISLSEQYDIHSKSLLDMSNTIINISNDLEKYRDNIDFKDFEAESAQSFILTKLNEIEKEYNIVKSKVDPIVNSIDKLKKDENNLYETKKGKYPDKSDEDIVLEISRFLEK